VNDNQIAFATNAIWRMGDFCSQRSILIPSLSRWVRLLERDISIVSCLDTSLDCSATDPRDKIYAIVGLIKPHIRRLITIDYMLTVEDVLRQAVIACIADCGDLDILCYAGLATGNDLTTSSTLDVQQFKNFLADKSRKKVYKYKPFLRESIKKPKRKLVHDFSILKARSQQYESPVQGPSDSTAQSSQPCIPPGQLLPRLRVCSRFVCFCGETSSLEAEKLFAAFGADTKQLRASHWLILLEASLAHGRDTVDLPADDLQSVKQGILLASDYTLSRDPWVFRARDCFGFTDSRCQPGDAIFFISGVLQPFLLRKVRHSVYRIVGACGIWVSERFSSEESKRKIPSFAASPPAPWALLESDFCDASEQQCIEIY
jgi:hypothetical protein